MTEPTSTPDGGLREAWAHVVRDHCMPPNKDSHGYPYRMGWWDAVIYLDKILIRGLRSCDDCPGSIAEHPQPVPTPDSEGGRQCAGCGQRLRQMNPPWPRLWTCESKDCPGNLADRFHDYPTFAPDSEGVEVVHYADGAHWSGWCLATTGPGTWNRSVVTCRTCLSLSSDTHQPFTDDGVTYCGVPTDMGVADGCGEVWPCSTVRSKR